MPHTVKIRGVIVQVWWLLLNAETIISFTSLLVKFWFRNWMVHTSTDIKINFYKSLPYKWNIGIKVYLITSIVFKVVSQQGKQIIKPFILNYRIFVSIPFLAPFGAFALFLVNPLMFLIQHYFALCDFDSLKLLFILLLLPLRLSIMAISLGSENFGSFCFFWDSNSWDSLITKLQYKVTVNFY